jgi:hypothetical protein
VIPFEPLWALIIAGAVVVAIVSVLRRKGK